MAKLVIEVETKETTILTRISVDGVLVGLIQSLEFRANKDTVIPELRVALPDHAISYKSVELLQKLPYVQIERIPVPS